MDSQETVAEPAMPPTLCEYAAEVTAARLDRMLSHSEGVREGSRTEPVHQMRVWSRRSRAALEIFHVCFSTQAFAEVEREVKAATDALSEARDLDVMIENLEARATELPASHRTGIEAFVTRLRGEREALQPMVAAAVTDLESHNLAARFRQLTEEAASRRDAETTHSGRKTLKKARHNGKRVHKHG